VRARADRAATALPVRFRIVNNLRDRHPGELNLVPNWTELITIEQYEQLVEAARQEADGEHLRLAQWEPERFNQIEG